MPSSRRLRMPMPVGAVAAAILATGCGGSDDGGSGERSSNSDKAQIATTVDRLYAAMRDQDAAGVCATLSKPAQRQVAAGGIGTGGGATCAKAFQGFLDASERQGGLNLVLKAKVKRVIVDGNTAVAKMTFGDAERKGDIPLVKQDGEWKLDRVGATPAQ